jgi:hypothetical protein
MTTLEILMVKTPAVIGSFDAVITCGVGFGVGVGA